MKVISKCGNVMPVDDSNINYENTYEPCVQVVTMIDDNVCLQPVWIATIQKDINWCNSRRSELEFVSERVYESKPTNEQLIYLIAENGLNIREGYVTVEKSYRLHIKED